MAEPRVGCQFFGGVVKLLVPGYAFGL